jgi:hypothetical protein
MYISQTKGSIFPRTERLCFELVNEIINMVYGHANLDVLDNCDLHPAQCLGCLFGQKEGIFLGENNVFYLKFCSFFLFFRKFAKFSRKRNHVHDVECKSKRVFLQFWMFTFLSFQ